MNFKKKRLKLLQKFCSQGCYRKYMSKRFDRYIASPVTLALPQNYDEFLTQESLSCLVEGCKWAGQNLSCHMNFSHGLTADEVKRAGGFNLSTGLVSMPLHQKFCEQNKDKGFSAPPPNAAPGKRRVNNYKSKEGTEHYEKSSLIKRDETGPTRECRFCHQLFSQSTPFGFTIFCSVKCRADEYRERYSDKKYSLECSFCKNVFYGIRNQVLRASRGEKICCSISCRQSLNGSKSKPSLLYVA